MKCEMLRSVGACGDTSLAAVRDALITVAAEPVFVAVAAGAGVAVAACTATRTSAGGSRD